jgi:ketosteroid isomerase-like protein
MRIEIREVPTLMVGLAMVAVVAISCAPAAEVGEEAEPGAVETVPETTAAQPADVDAAVDEFIAAWEREDVEAAVGAFTADAVAYDPVPPGRFAGTAGIREWIADTFAELDQIDITLAERTVHTADGVGWFQSRYVFAAQPAQPGAEPIRDEGYVSILWVRQEDGSYLSPLFHASPIPEGAPQEDGGPAVEP